MALQQGTVQAGKRVFDVIVIRDRCKECGLCIEMCPTKVLDRENTYNVYGYRPTFLKNRARCIGCKICENICPEFAIFVREVFK